MGNVTTKFSKGIMIHVDVNYNEKDSHPFLHKFLFYYSVMVENKTSFPIKIVQRYLNFIDGAKLHELTRDCRISEMVLSPGAKRSFESAVVLNSEIAHMMGTIKIELMDEHLKPYNSYWADLPETTFIYPGLLN